ncbi:MAG: hypothetical protein JWM27_1491 [Gemmatimonadetes bacterium]|nr:hypothetical protein [Gemmatimonadota bacterium]
MNRDRDVGDPTFDSVRGRYREWRDENPAPASESALSFRDGLPVPELSEEAGRVVFTAVGVGIGLLLLVLAATALHAAGTWTEAGRDGAQVGYLLCFVFLTIAGLGGIIASYNHNYRVMARKSVHH